MACLARLPVVWPRPLFRGGAIAGRRHGGGGVWGPPSRAAQRRALATQRPGAGGGGGPAGASAAAAAGGRPLPVGFENVFEGLSHGSAAAAAEVAKSFLR